MQTSDMIRFLSCFLLWLIPFSSCISQQLSSVVNELKSDPDLAHGSWSITVYNTKTDSSVLEYNSQASLVPASTLKILTTGAALCKLGPDFKFTTVLAYTGNFDTLSGVLNGDLYIVGGGDPSLGSEYFKSKKDSLTTIQNWVKSLQKSGLKKIEGSVIADDRIFEDNPVPSQWIWGDMGNYFGAGACGLSYGDNKFTAHFSSSVAGSSTKLLRIVPEVNGLQLSNTVTAGGRGDNAFIYGSPYSYQRFVQGTIPANQRDYEVDGSLPDPALFCAQLLTQELNQNGISVLHPATSIREIDPAKQVDAKALKQLLIYNSPTLEKIIYWTNLKSINLYAEHLLKYLSYLQHGVGEENDGTERIVAFWKSKGIDTDGLFMNDGCGLARANVITTKTEAQVLLQLSKESCFPAFYNSLPVAGKSGSLGNLCEGTSAENNLHAKSGYITRARGYAGYVKNKKGELLCFSVLANNYTCSAIEMKKKLEKVLVALASME